MLPNCSAKISQALLGTLLAAAWGIPAVPAKTLTQQTEHAAGTAQETQETTPATAQATTETPASHPQPAAQSAAQSTAPSVDNSSADNSSADNSSGDNSSADNSPTAQPTARPPENAPASPDLPASLQTQLEALWQQHRIPVLLSALAVGSYGAVLLFRPLWLLKLPSSDIAVPWTNWKVPLGLVRALKYRSRVLDAWVARRWQTAKPAFAALPTVADRSIHISLPVQLNHQQTQQIIDSLSGQELKAIFARSSAVLLITGEGGAGKTSLACQIAQWGLQKQLARHRMLPVLIETELTEQRTFLEAVRGQLSQLTNHGPEPVSPELAAKLMQRQRVLVIVDHFSEMGAQTREQISPELADFPAKALIVTSRLEEALGSSPKAVLAPLRIEGDRLSQFIHAYLQQRGKRALFEDEDYFDACRRLSRMVGQRNITLLLAKLYVDQMIQQQEGAGGSLPASVPELMLCYLNQLNGTLPEAEQRDALAVRRDAQRVAWACLKQTYRPAAAAIEGETGVLAVLDEPANGYSAQYSAQDRLDYLERRLRLLETPEPKDKVRLVLDPLAEYLAALHLVDYCREDPQRRWGEFLASIDQVLALTNDPPEAIAGFLLAVRDCCLLRAKEAQVPPEVSEMLARKVGLDPEELRRLEEKRRIRLLISDLAAPELEYRIRAAEDLAEKGLAATLAVPNLLGMVENPNQELLARQAAARALGAVGRASEEACNQITPALIELVQSQLNSQLTSQSTNEDEGAVLRSVAEALGTMKAGQGELRELLASDSQPLAVRQGAARALSDIGAPSGQLVPMLVVTLQGEQTKAQVKEIPVWKVNLAPDTSSELALEMVNIPPAGEFLMGSPPDEAGRDVYQDNPYFPECQGLDVEAQHRVQVAAFAFGRYPVTQAQWRAVAALPPVNRNLDPDPSNFKGDRRPVECVSWNEAMEFCDRISAYTGHPFRLPTEAEWEYACRAGTLTPFHLGDTLSAELANYDANYTYAEGALGQYRQQTTEVGSFGVVNAFGLAEMHGNLYDWCLDPWHSSYEGAPTDGSAWITEGDERYRLVRGGSWLYNPHYCRAAFRLRYFPSYRYNLIGLRVVCVAPWTS